MPPAGVLGAEPLSLMPQHFPREPAKRGSRVLAADQGFFDRLVRTAAVVLIACPRSSPAAVFFARNCCGAGREGLHPLCQFPQRVATGCEDCRRSPPSFRAAPAGVSGRRKGAAGRIARRADRFFQMYLKNPPSSGGCSCRRQPAADSRQPKRGLGTAAPKTTIEAAEQRP